MKGIVLSSLSSKPRNYRVGTRATSRGSDKYMTLDSMTSWINRAVSFKWV